MLEALAAELFVERATEEDRQRLQAAFAAGKRAVERGDIAGSLMSGCGFTTPSSRVPGTGASP